MIEETKNVLGLLSYGVQICRQFFSRDDSTFIDNDADAELLTGMVDDFARAIAVGITDYEQG